MTDSAPNRAIAGPGGVAGVRPLTVAGQAPPGGQSPGPRATVRRRLPSLGEMHRFNDLP
jgi:hypothetical protein